MTIDPQNINISEFSISDIDILMDYWFRSPLGFIESMGVDLAKLPTKSEFRSRIKNLIRNENSDSSNQNKLVYI